MKRDFYLRLALDGMKKNKRLYLPYLLTCAGMVMMFYILSSLAYSPLMRSMRGGNSMSMILRGQGHAPLGEQRLRPRRTARAARAHLRLEPVQQRGAPES